MEQYEIIKTILCLLPILLIFIVFIFARNLKWQHKYPTIIILGWIIVYASTVLIWYYSFNYAPNQEIAEEVAMSDGAPVAFSYMFGWVYALILMLIMDGIDKGYSYLLKKRKGNK